MKERIFHLVFAMTMGIILAGCGGGGGDSSSSTGTISMNITDAKPVLPVLGTVESVSITFDEVSVHKSGGGWVTLPAVQQPYTIDLYQFSDGIKTQFVPPVELTSGNYTQVRIGVTSGTIRINGVDHPLGIPSSNLKTDKNFEFDVAGGRAVDLTVDFDLSQSIVVTGVGTYQLKPVLHINKTSEAATIQGTINFGSSTTQATVIVTWDKNGDGTFQAASDSNPDEGYTRLLVQSTDPAPFRVFWLVPNQGYFIQVLLGNPQSPARDTGRVYVPPRDLSPGAVYNLNNGNSI